MPGWFLHMHAAREGLRDLGNNPSAGAIFALPGASPAQLEQIARANPAYVALGAIGPDIFFLLPDFKPPVGNMMWKIANEVREIYTWWDDHFLGPFESAMGPIGNNQADQLNALSGGLKQTVEGIFGQAFGFLKGAIQKLILQQYDFFGLLSSGTSAGYDEQSFFWSDMLHYRETYRFATALWQRGGDPAIVKDPVRRARFRAFALGWMTHLATDVVGHAFVNQKVGGPYRLHGQRHHLVENHMDAQVYNAIHGGGPIYDQMANAALHLWLAFNPDGSSRVDLFAAQPNPPYQPGTSSADINQRNSVWNFDSQMPADLAAFVADTLRAVYEPALTNPDEGLVACCPTIISTLAERPPIATGGYANKNDIIGAYWWVYRYLKWVTTDHYKIRRPDPPSVVIIPSFPSVPGSGDADPGPGASSDDSFWDDALSFLISLLAWAEWLAQVAVWPVAVIAGIVAGTITWPLRWVIYEYLELPLYNLWLAIHTYLAMTGYVMPMPGEISSGLTTLGVSVSDGWAVTIAALGDPDGGLTPANSTLDPAERARGYPKDVLLDPPSHISLFSQIFEPGAPVVNGQFPSEFTRPWRWPAADNQGNAVNIEQPNSLAGPFAAGISALQLFGTSPGDVLARQQFEAAQNEAQSIQAAAAHLPQGRHLGDPVDYSAHVVATLTRAGVALGQVVNFNLDADRGYAYLCWDWQRFSDRTSTPEAFRNMGDPDQGGAKTDASMRVYPTPVRPGYGWNPQDQLHLGGQPALSGFNPDDPAAGVTIRYIRYEKKFL